GSDALAPFEQQGIEQARRLVRCTKPVAHIYRQLEGRCSSVGDGDRSHLLYVFEICTVGRRDTLGWHVAANDERRVAKVRPGSRQHSVATRIVTKAKNGQPAAEYVVDLPRLVPACRRNEQVRLVC